MHVWSSGLSCEALAASGPPGFHTTAREPKRAYLRVPALKNTTKIQREDPQRDTKRAKWWRDRGKKKSEILGGPAEGGPGRGRSG